jgi:hypothetical protein
VRNAVGEAVRIHRRRQQPYQAVPATAPMAGRRFFPWRILSFARASSGYDIQILASAITRARNNEMRPARMRFPRPYTYWVAWKVNGSAILDGDHRQSSVFSMIELSLFEESIQKLDWLYSRLVDIIRHRT